MSFHKYYEINFIYYNCIDVYVLNLINSNWDSYIQERTTCIANKLEENAYKYAQQVWEHVEECKEN